MTHIVFWEDEPSRTRAVTHICAVCKRFLKREYGLTLGYDSAIVSPTGRAHVEADHNEGYTACGRAATGPDWWWRSESGSLPRDEVYGVRFAPSGWLPDA